MRRLVAVALVVAASATAALAGGIAILGTTLTDNGDHDGFADTNETISLSLQIQNTSGAALTGVTALLTTKTPELVCITTSTVDLGDLAAGEIVQSDPFVFHVLDVDRATLGLDPYDLLAASFEVFAVTADDSIPRVVTPKVELDLDLDVMGGSGPTTFFEGFESQTLGAFENDNIDAGKNSLEASDGYRCQQSDPDWVNAHNYDSPSKPQAYLGQTAEHADAVFWGLSGPGVSPLGGRAYGGQYSLYYGVDLGPPDNWTTPLNVLEAVRTTQPIHLGWDGAPPVLSFKHQASLAAQNCPGYWFNHGKWDRGVVLLRVADAGGAPSGPWIKVYPYQNAYDAQPTLTEDYAGWMFDPTDDGNAEDDFFDPTSPARVYGPSSTCWPEYSFADIGETSELFDAANVGHADGPGLAGFWGIGTWIESRFDLSRFRGRSVRLRLLASSRGISVTLLGETWNIWATQGPTRCDDGWWIDDVTLTGALETAATVLVDGTDNSGLPGPPAGDGDTDGILDVCDNCAGAGNADQRDQDGDGLGDACDPCTFEPWPLINFDLDGDGICTGDNCPTIANPEQVDGDADTFGFACDCDDADDATYPGAPEVLDGLDNQCPGEVGYGAVDEVSGLAGFYNPDNKNVFSWTGQAGAISYQVGQASKADFTAGCGAFDLPITQTSYTIVGLLPAGQIRFFLVRPLTPMTGSWGLRSSGVERTVPCAAP